MYNFIKNGYFTSKGVGYMVYGISDVKSCEYFLGCDILILLLQYPGFS